MANRATDADLNYDGASQASSRRSRASGAGAGVANTSKPLIFSEPTATRWLTRYFPLFPVLLSLKPGNLQIVSLLGMFVCFMQHAGLLLNPHFSAEWGTILGNEISDMFYGFLFTVYDPSLVAKATPVAMIVLDYFVLCVGLCIVCCILLQLRTREELQAEAKTTSGSIARFLLSVVSGPLFLPIVFLCFASTVCTTNKKMSLYPDLPDTQCWSGLHIATFIPGVLSFLIILPLAYIKTVCIYEYFSLSDNFLAKRYSFMDKVGFICDVLNCGLFVISISFEAPALYSILHAVFSAIQVLGYIVVLPYYNMGVNRFYVCLHSAEVIACVFLTPSFINYNFHSSGVTSALFLGFGLLSSFCLALFTDFRVNPLFVLEYQKAVHCMGSIDATNHRDEKRKRKEIDAFGEGKEDDEDEDELEGGDDLAGLKIDDEEVRRLPYPKGLASCMDFSPYGSLNTQVLESITRQQLNCTLLGGEKTKVRPAYSLSVPYICHCYGWFDPCLAASYLDVYARKFGIGQISEMMLLFGANIFGRAQCTFIREPFVLLSFINFITTYLPGLSFMGADLLKLALHERCTIEEEFRSLKQANDLRNALGIRTHAHSIRSGKARATHGRILQLMNRFWVKLTEPSVNIKEVAEVADNIRSQRRAAIDQYDAALAQQQSVDPAFLRRLGDFFSQVLMSPDAAQECYSEARDIYEMRQARSMRGTRQHTVEVDVAALTERMRQLLRFHSAGGGLLSSKASASGIIQAFSVILVVIFTFLVVFCSLQVYLVTTIQNSLSHILMTIYCIGSLWTSTLRLGASVVMIESGFSVTSLDGTLQNEIGSLLTEFLNAFKYVVSGAKNSLFSDELTPFLTVFTIPMYSIVSENTGGYSLWGLSEDFLQAVDRYINETNPIAGGTFTEFNERFAIESSGVLANGFEKYLDLEVNTRITLMSSTWMIFLLCIFILNAILLMVAYASIIFVFERTSLGRVFTFQLFTLIPYDSLEKLATTARERYHQIHMEKSFRSSNTPASTVAKVVEAPQTNNSGNENPRKADTVEVTKTTVLPYSKSKDSPLKSCLKKDGETAPAAIAKSKKGAKKQVAFNPVVEVVGGGSDAKKEGSTKDAADGVAGGLVAPPKNKQKKRAESQKFSEDNSSSSVKLLVLLFFVVLIFTLVIIASLGFSFFELQTYKRNMAEFVKFQQILNQCVLKVPQGIESTVRFLFSGSLTVFQSAQDDIIGVINSIPQMMGTSIPSESVGKLVEMHKIVKTMQNTSLDASSLASFSLGVSLAHWGDAYDRSQMTEAELSAQLQAKYPTEYAAAEKIFAVAGTSADLSAIFSYTIMADKVVNSLSDFLSLGISVYDELLEKEYASAPISSTLIIVALACACTPAAFALLLAVTPLHRYGRKYITRTAAFMAFLSFSGVIVVCAYLITQGDSIDLGFRPYSDAVYSLAEFSAGSLRRALLLQGFVLSANPYSWFKWQEVSVYSSSRYLSQFLLQNELNMYAASLFVSAGERLWEINRLGNVSSALAINSLQSAMVVEAPMQDALTFAAWDYASEPNYEYNQVWYPEDIFYTTKAADLAEPLDTQLKIAWTTTMGSEYYAHFYELAETLSSIGNVIVAGELQSTMECEMRHRRILFIALSLCVLPVVTFIFFALKLRKAIKDTYNSNTGSRNASTDQFKYQAMLQRTLITLMILGIFYAATFGVGMWITQTGFVYARQMTYSARVEALVASSLLSMWKVVSAQLSFSSPSLIKVQNRNIYVSSTEEFMRQSDNGVPIGLKQSTSLDEYMFGKADSAYMIQLLTSFFCDRCGGYIMGSEPLGNQSNYVPVSGLTTTISGALTDWVAYMTQAFTDAESPDSTLEDVSKNLTLNSVLSGPLLSATRTSTTVLLNSFIDTQKKYGDILLGLAVVSLLLTVFGFLVVGVPAIYRLFDEGHAVRTLLQIIPASIRDEVPAIQQHVETGQISGASELHRKFEQNEKLLQNILPQKIANRLKSGEQPIADTHECVTILFTDFVGFTKRSSTMQAGEIVAFLNEVFLEFDTVVELLALEKIKTIGDAFFMAGGLDPHVPDHALRVVEAGLMFFEALDEHNKRHPGRIPLQMRLGVHSGPVVAGVIGIKKVAYDLWGESVEIANAMESTGVPGFVHISETTAAFVRGIFRLAPRGELPREKEHIPDDMPKTYLVVGRILPTPYMHLRRPRLMPTSLGADGKP